MSRVFIFLFFSPLVALLMENKSASLFCRQLTTPSGNFHSALYLLEKLGLTQTYFKNYLKGR